jgi:hypothetical protein
VLAQLGRFLTVAWKPYRGPTLKSLIEEHARLNLSDFLSTLLAIFHVISKKVHPARLLIYLVNKQVFSNPARLFRSARLLGTSE